MEWDRMAGYSLPVYIFICEDTQRANYWYRKTCEKFTHCWREWKHFVGSVYFADCSYHFVSQYIARDYLRGRQKYNPTVYPEECIYIILDDVERFRIGESGRETTYYKLWKDRWWE